MTVLSGIAPVPLVGHGLGSTIKVIGATVTVGTAGLATNATTNAIRVPIGFTVLDCIMTATDMDTGTPALVLALGDADDDDRIITGSTIGQGGGVATLNNVAGLLHRFTAVTTLQIKATTAAATAAAGTVKVALFGTLSDSATS
jgi:hypothetical protein